MPAPGCAVNILKKMKIFVPILQNRKKQLQENQLTSSAANMKNTKLYRQNGRKNAMPFMPQIQKLPGQRLKKVLENLHGLAHAPAKILTDPAAFMTAW